MATVRVKITREENAEFYGVDIGDCVTIELNSYVAGVTASEIGNSHPEACKAQAVAARTFAALKNWSLSDSSSTDQAFRAARCGSGLYPNAVNAATETSGQILTYNDKPISAVYSACNGGRTVSSLTRWGSVRPYLIEQDDPWDDSTKRTGHGVGMSQRGAKYAASIGMSYVDILAFYYPGTKITQLKEGDEHLIQARDFIEKLWIPANEQWGYIWGQWGAVWTEAKQKVATRDMTVKYGSKWIGRRVVDCSGLIRWACNELGESVAHHATYLYTDYCQRKGKLVKGKKENGEDLLPGTLVFLKGSEEKIHHVGAYVGDGAVIEAKGTQSGVIVSDLSKWDYWGELKCVDYSEFEAAPTVTPDIVAKAAVKASVNNPGRWLNVRQQPKEDSKKLFELHKGDIVDIVEITENGKWCQIRYGGKVGWVSGKYLVLLEPEDQEEVPEVEDPEEWEPDEESYTEKERPATVLDELLSIRMWLDDIIARMGGKAE